MKLMSAIKTGIIILTLWIVCEIVFVIVGVVTVLMMAH